MKYFYVIVLVGLLLSGCKKNPLPPDSDDSEGNAVFYMRFNANGLPVNIEAGKDNYYMYSSHYQDTSNVYVYKGELKQKGCSGACNYGITILINDYVVSQSGGPMYPDSGLFVGKYQFNDGSTEPAYYNGIFTATYPSTSGTFTWKYSDGGQQSGDIGTHKFRAGKKYTVGLTLNETSGPYSLTNEFRVGNPLQCNVSMQKDTPATALRFLFTPQPTYYSPNTTCIWKFTNAANTFNYLTADYSPSQLFPSADYYNATLTMKNAMDTCVVNYQVPAFFNGLPHANYTSTFVPIPNYKKLCSMTFLVTDPNGNVYSSGMINQPTSSNVQIVSVEGYDTNDQGQPTKKVKIRFNCTVKDMSNNNTLNINDGEAVIAVSYQ